QGSAEEQDHIGLRHPPEYVARKPTTSAPAQPTGGSPAVKALLQIHSQAPFLLDPQDSKELRSLLAEEDYKTIDQLFGAVIFNGQPARMEKYKTHTFVTEVNMNLEDGQVVVKPTTQTVQVGTTIIIVPDVAADRKGLCLEIQVEHSDLAPGAPARTITVNVSG